ncbi:MAG TPA: CAP domain-containing protein [Brumimicrobium sp.]|nr:CAP domain-containing protein [Brumimicrobium sp.]
MRILSFYKIVFLLFFSTSYCVFIHSQTALRGAVVDAEILNKEIIKEVNKLRKQAKVPPLRVETALSLASEDHAKYMLDKEKLTHKQRNRHKRTPKNRVDFYGQLFDRVGENVQLNNLNLNASAKDKTHPKIDTYEKLAEQLVISWKNSPPHYANMINGDFLTTYTSVAIGPNGEVYACQLFGGSKYQDKYRKQRDTIDFKPDRPWRCWRCKLRPPAGSIYVTEDSTIIFRHTQPRFFFGLLLKPSIFNSRMRFFKRRKDGLMADIIVKSQYPCDSNSYHNGLSNIRGIPLEPVYKKDFDGGIGLRETEIVLGKVPSFIDEEFEVNLVVIQNKRPCSNTLFNVIPSDFYVDIPLSYDFEPLVRKIKRHELDTLDGRMYFDKSEIIPRDSILSTITKQVQLKKDQIEKIEIKGFASIEGSKKINVELYSKRADYLIEMLEKIKVDSSLVEVHTAENFTDFRKDIKGTKFEYLDSLTDAQLKEELLDKELSTELEFLFKNHRYVDIRIITRRDYELAYNKESVNSQLAKEMASNNLQKCLMLQRIQFALLKANEMTVEEILSINIPMEKKYAKLLHNSAIMKYAKEPITIETLQEFRADLWEIRGLKENDKLLNTSVAIIDYYLYEMGNYTYKKKTFYDSIKNWKYIDRVQQARILLNASTHHDWGWWRATGSRTASDYWYRKVQRYIRSAQLDVDKTFEIASYYAFFRQEKYAYSLVKRKIDDTENPNDLIFFLKLIHLTDIKIPRRVYLNYFKKIKRYSGEEFCTFFNNPALNFQILDDEEIKSIYCEECNERK